MANLNDDTEIANLKDEDEETVVCDIVDSTKGTIHDKADKKHDEITNFEWQEETQQIVNEDSNEFDIQEDKTVVEKLEIASESAYENLPEEMNSESVATNISDLIDDDNNPETEIITMANLNDETEIANLKDENKKIIVCDIADFHELAKGTIHDKAGKGHDKNDITNYECQEETLQTVNEDSNKVDVQEEKTAVERLEIASESASENLLEETISESVATNINDLIDGDNNPETEIITMANLNDDTEIANLKDEDEETIVCDIVDSHESAKGTIHDKDGKKHDEITNFEWQEETRQTVNEDSNEFDTQEDKTVVENLDITSESASENLPEEMRSESVATNINDLIDDDNNPETEIITMANLNDETEIANLKDEDKETVVCDISNSHKSSEVIIHDKDGKVHDEITNFDCQEETQQTVKVEDRNEVDIPEEKMDVGKLEITSESVSKNLFEEMRSESVAANVHDLIDDDNNPETEIITVAKLNDESEIENLKDEDKEMVVCDISNSHESDEGTLHDKWGKGHDEITNFDCQEETQQTVNVEDNNKVDILEEKTDVGKLEINSESASQKLFEETHSESMATSIHDLIDDDNNLETEIIPMANLNHETEITNLKDDDKESVVCDISSSHESAKGAINDNVGKVHDEITSFEYQEETQQTVNVEDSNGVDILEEKTDVGKPEITAESASKNLFEETHSESVATNVHDLIKDDNNPETEETITMANLNDETKIANLKDEDKETVVYDIPNSHELAEGTIYDKNSKVNDEITNFDSKEETQQTVNAEDNNEVDILEEKTNAGMLRITSNSASKKLLKETHSESVATNIHDLIDDDNIPETEIITIANFNDEAEKAKLKDEDNKETVVCDTSNSHELVEGTIHDKVGEVHDETTTSECQEENQQSVNAEDNNKVDIQEEKTDVEKLKTNIHGLIDDDNNSETEMITTIANLNDETEIAKMKEEDNEEMSVCDIPGLTGFVEGTLHDKVGKRHEETANFECQEETCQTVKAEDSNEVGNHEEKKNVKKLEISSESVSEDQIEETNSVPVVTNIHDSIDDGNPENEKIIQMVILNDEPETAKLKNMENTEQNVGDISDSCEMAERMIHDRVGKRHEETTNTVSEEETSQMISVEDKNDAHNQEERTGIEKFEIIAKETNSETVATSIHDTVDDDNSRKEIAEMENLDDNPDSAIVKDEYHQEHNIGNISDIRKSVEGTICDVPVTQHEETTYTAYEKNINQNTDSKEATEDVAHEEGESTKNLEMISNAVAEDQVQEMTCEAETMQIESTLGDCTSSKGAGGPLTVSEIIYEDKKKKEPLPDFASSEARGNMDNQLAEKDKTYETSVTTYESNSQEKPKVFRMYDSRDENQPKETNVNTTGSGVSEEDISESALSTSQDLVKEKTSATCFSAEGDDCRHQEREHSKSLETTYSEEAKTIEEAGSMPNKQPQDIEVGKPNEECEFSCEEDINGFESEKNEEEKTDTEKAIDVRHDTSSKTASEEPEAAIQTEPPWEQTKVATEAVNGNDKVVAESIITSQENSETKTGQNSIEVDDERLRDTVNDFSSAYEASAERNIQKNASEEELGGLIHDIAVDPESMLEDETNNKQDGCVSSETKALLEDETQDGVQPEKKVCQTIEGGESYQKESLEKKKTSDVNFGKSLQEDENKEHEKVFVSDAAEGTTLDELQKLASMIGCEKVEEMDAINKNTEKMVIGYSDTDTGVEQPTNVEASGYHSQMDKIELPTLENVGTKHERTEELNTKLQEDSEELRKYEHIPIVVLERVKVAESGEKTERNITVEEDISEAPGACLRQETQDEHFPEDGTKVQKKESQTKCEIETTDTMVDESSNEEDKEFDSTPSKNFSRTIFTDKDEPQMEKLDEQKIVEATPDAYMETERPHEQFQKDDIVADNEKSQHKWELDSTYITKNQSPNDEVKELDCKPSEESADLEDETALFVDLQDEKKNLEAAPGACMKDELRKDKLDKENELGIEKKEIQTPWEPNFIDKENEPSNINVVVWDCLPPEQNTVIDFAEKLDTNLLTNDEGEKLCSDTTINACMKDETSHAQLLKDGIKAEKNNEQETRWELQPTDDTEFDSSPSEENTFTTVWAEKIRNLLTEEDVKKNVDVAASSCTKHETNHEQFQTDDITAEKNKEPSELVIDEEDNNEILQFDISQDEEKHRDCDDLPVSHLLLQHILRNNSDIQDQATNAGPEENVQEMNGKRIVCTGVEKQGETFTDELEESHETLEDMPQLLEKEDFQDVQQNTASVVAREAETPQSSMSSPSLAESKDTMDNEQISEDDSIYGKRISREKACPEEIENTSELVIDEVNHDRKEKTEISEVKDDENQNNLHGSSIFTVDEGVKDEVSSLLPDVSTNENAPMTIENNGKSTTPGSENDQKDHSTIDEKTTSKPENVHKDFDFSSMDKNYQEDNSRTKAEEKSISVSETIVYTDSILQSEETETSPRYNQNTKSYEPMSEIHVHANEQASEVKPDATIRKEELREENDNEITETAQNVDSYSSEEPNMSYSEEDQQSNIMSESTNETLQTTAKPPEEKTTKISKDKNETKERADPQTEEDKTDEEKDEVEEADDHKIEDGVAVTVEERDAGSKKAHKKSQNILSGVGSKVKNSLAKVKKAIIGKSSQPKAASPK